MKTLNQDTLNKLIALAKDLTIYDKEEEPVIDDYAGGNVDDAYALGEENGQTNLAREILAEIGVDWND